MKCTALHYHHSVIAKVTPMKTLSMEKIEVMQKRQTLTGIISSVGAQTTPTFAQ